jgi:hypothetical protein
MVGLRFMRAHIAHQIHQHLARRFADDIMRSGLDPEELLQRRMDAIATASIFAVAGTIAFCT